MKDNTKQAFENINFVERYKKFGVAHQHEIAELLVEYDSVRVSEILRRVTNLSVEELKEEDSFVVTSQNGFYEFIFGVNVKYGMAGLYSLTKFSGNLFEASGPWGYIANMLGNEGSISSPVFTSYAELEQILTEAFAIYEDFKKELIKLESSE